MPTHLSPVPVCPETGRDLASVDRRAHADNLWPEAALDPRVASHAKAVVRRTAVLGGSVPDHIAEEPHAAMELARILRTYPPTTPTGAGGQGVGGGGR